ncbi:hypothetical protein L7F22_036512 [Adiantum nelumboides]|nr:hypothetical protein [Adiantum nelumboides]
MYPLWKKNHASINCYKIKKCVKCGKVGYPPQFCPKGGSGSIPSHGSNNGNTSSKGRRILYTHSDDEDDNDDNGTFTNDELHFISTTSSPCASTSSSSSFSNKVHAKGSPKKGKKTYFYESGDDLL